MASSPVPSHERFSIWRNTGQRRSKSLITMISQRAVHPWDLSKHSWFHGAERDALQFAEMERARFIKCQLDDTVSSSDLERRPDVASPLFGTVTLVVIVHAKLSPCGASHADEPEYIWFTNC